MRSVTCLKLHSINAVKKNSENHNDPQKYTSLKFISLTRLFTNILVYLSHLGEIEF